MSQNDFTIANADGATVRADINSALQALASQSSGTAAPSTTFAFQPWWDTTTGLLKFRDAANGTFLPVGTLGTSGFKPYYNGASTFPNAALDVMPATTIKGNDGTASATPSDLTATQVATMLGAVGGVMKSKIVTVTYALNTASGTVSVSGVGFQPSSVMLYSSAVITGSTTPFTSYGMADSAKTCVMLCSGVGGTGVFQPIEGNIFRIFTDTTTSNFASGSLSAYGTDGFSLAVTKTGTLVGTAALYALCLR